MCKAVEDYATEKVRREDMVSATNLLKDGVAADIVAKAFKSLSRADVDGLYQKIANNEI